MAIREADPRATEDQTHPDRGYWEPVFWGPWEPLGTQHFKSRLRQLWRVGRPFRAWSILALAALASGDAGVPGKQSQSEDGSWDSAFGKRSWT